MRCVCARSIWKGDENGRGLRWLCTFLQRDLPKLATNLVAPRRAELRRRDRVVKDNDKLYV
jgi:hypothetical protein